MISINLSLNKRSSSVRYTRRDLPLSNRSRKTTLPDNESDPVEPLRPKKYWIHLRDTSRGEGEVNNDS